MKHQGRKIFPDEEHLVTFANNFAVLVSAPMIVWLKGELGSGKTSFARALIRALGYRGRIKSPTYGLLEHYPLGRLKVLHLDLYRIGDADELEFMGLADMLDGQTIVLVEWPEKVGRWLPEPDFVFEFSYTSPGRSLEWSAATTAARLLDVNSI